MLPTNGLDQVSDSLSGIPEVVGCAILPSGRVEEPGWHVVQMTDGRRCRIDFAPGTSASTIASATAIVSALVLQPLTPVQTAKRRAKQLLRSMEPYSILLRSVLKEAFPGRPMAQLLSGIDTRIDLDGSE